ncbi:MAG: dihydroneopterin aldolase [Cyanobacteriota bacterium]|nr:dihydroneopterin aldolase [Cyanobacteriota bacterium]
MADAPAAAAPGGASDCLRIRGLRAYGYTGFFDEEQRLGQWFEVELALWLDLAAAARDDDLAGGLDYAAVATAVQELVEGARFRTIERLTSAICERVLAWGAVEAVEATLTKLHPPIPGFSGQVAITLRRRRADAPPER